VRSGRTPVALVAYTAGDQRSCATVLAGAVEPRPWQRPKPAQALDVSRQELTVLLTSGTGEVLDDADRIAASQEEWKRVRQAPGVRGRELSELAAWLYPEADRAPGGHVLTSPGWLMEQPVDLDAIRLRWDTAAPEHTPPKPELTEDLLPLSATGARYTDYSRAVRDIVRPRLLENRTSYRLTEADTSPPRGLGLSFTRTTFFDVFNLKQLVAHEFKRAWLRSGGQVPRWDDLPLRADIGRPDDPGRLLMSPGINILTIRRGGPSEEPSFVLHERDGEKVADGGGLCHVMPAGEFQPSSGNPTDVENDFSLWRNIMREFSEEFLGNPEHDGSGSRSIDYEHDEPFVRFEQSRESGALRLWHYGLVAEPLELGVMQLTVAVVEAGEYDRLFATMVGVNDEGRVVGQHSARSIPFTADAVDRLEPRLTSSALTLLKLAWRDRNLLLA
jgi:hypothetical protein